LKGAERKNLPGGGLSVLKHPAGVFSEEPGCRGCSEGARLQGNFVVGVGGCKNGIRRQAKMAPLSGGAGGGVILLVPL